MFGSNACPLFAVETSQIAVRRYRAVGGRLLPVLAFVATLLAGASPAWAAAVAVTSVRADFDNDGIPDTVTVINDGQSSQVRVWLSHRARFRVLRIPDEVVSVVATDVNADGRVDVRASTRRTGVWIWLNQGRGHLRRVKPTLPTLSAKHRFGEPGQSWPASVARSVGDDDPPSSSLTDLQQVSFDGRPTVRAAARSPGITSSNDCSNTPPRAPPLR